MQTKTLPLLIALGLTATPAFAQSSERTARATRSDTTADSVGRVQSAGGTQIGTRRKFGLGVSLGDPTALSGKLYLQRHHGIDMALAFGPGPDPDLDVYAHAVYLVTPSILAREPGFELSWHLGAGGVVHDSPGWARDRFGPDHVAVGVRTPLGQDLDINEIPRQVFGDLAIDTYVVPATTVDLGAALGIRYYF